jgi:hypothetical protein
MQRYKVLAVNPQSAIVALVDDLGRHHVARAIAAPTPPPGLVLIGEPPAVGLRALQAETGDLACTVCLTLLDCDPQAAVLVVTGVTEGEQLVPATRP